MRASRIHIILFLLVCWIGFHSPVTAQSTKKKPASTQSKTTNSKTTKTKTPPKQQAPAPKKTELANAPQIDASQGDEKKVRDMIGFLEFVLNTLGAAGTPASDKDVVATESYSKIFRDAKVQIEDDLLEDRDVVTNKDVTAYLKDVDFFFKDVKFTFDIERIESGEVEGKKFYKVTMTRRLVGTSSEGEAITNNQPRFVELNYDPKTQDLKIVSMYTKGVDEKQGMLNWWTEMSYEWQSIFRKSIGKSDSVVLADVRQMIAITELNLHGNPFVQDIEPLAKLSNLQRLDISGTSITDLWPVRNLTELQEVNLSGAKITDVSVLRFATKMTNLNLESTSIQDVSVVSKMPDLKVLNVSRTVVQDLTPTAGLLQLIDLNASHTKVGSLAPIQNLTALQNIDLSNTRVSDLAPLRNLTNVTDLAIDSTAVTDLTPLGNVKSLTNLSANFSPIASLEPLKTLPKIQKIYCDHTPIRQDAADAFRSAKPGTLVVFDSQDLQVWWETLSSEWKSVLFRDSRIGKVPTKEQLALLANVDSLNLRGNQYISDLEPLRRLIKLKRLNVSGTGIHDLSPLKDHREIQILDLSGTEVADLSVVSKFPQLTTLRADRTRIQDIGQLSFISSLKNLYVDDTGIHDIHASDFLARNSKVLLVFKTYHVERWWSRLEPQWKSMFQKMFEIGDEPSKEQLHSLVEKASIQLKDFPIRDLSPLKEFVRLEDLRVSGSMLENLSTLSNFSLKTLHVTNSPLRTLDGILANPDLVELDISNTPITDVRSLSKLVNLTKLNCAGTEVRKLDYLETLTALEFFDCSNTSVGRLDGILNLPLKNLRCFNTKLSARQMEKYRQGHPDCEVVFY